MVLCWYLNNAVITGEVWNQMHFSKSLAGRQVAPSMKNQPSRRGLLHPENYLELETNYSSQKYTVARIINSTACGRSKVLFDKGEETPVYGTPTMPWMP